MRSVLLLALLVALTACDEPVVCTDLAAASVQVHLEDEQGAPITGAAVTWNQADAIGPAEDCLEMQAGDYTCGYEVEGALVVSISAPGFADETVTVEVSADECHVITEQVDVILEALDCTTEALPAVELTVVDGQGAEVTGADPQWSADGGATWASCDPAHDNVYQCAFETSGEIALSIDDAGPYEPWSDTVTVAHDGCHPITEAVTATLQYLPD